MSVEFALRLPELCMLWLEWRSTSFDTNSHSTKDIAGAQCRPHVAVGGCRVGDCYTHCVDRPWRDWDS